jgi:CsoR family transcriptional regulator, copper-sensing transcriptional repressor
MHNHGTPENKQKAHISLKKAQSLITKIKEMVDDDQYCIDIIQQVDAAIGLLNSSKKSLLEGHLYHCIEHKYSEDKKKTVEELLKIFNLKK